MLKLVGLGIAMQNADQTVKASATLVTEKSHDDELGLSTLLESLFL
jgi:hydroxymethylpyrimidine pyrophosphatase-like HAD family hydrolase